MEIWHFNTEEPAAIQKSSTPISNYEWPPPVEQAIQFEEALGTVDIPLAVAAHPKQKTQNNSVSPFSCPIFFELLSFTNALSDKNGDLGCPPLGTVA